MLETSKDLLNLVIAFCVLLFTVFLVWIMYYLVIILKNAQQLVAGIKKKFDILDEILKTVKEKIENTSSYLALLAEGLKQLLHFFKERKEVDKKKKK